jgi:hypothetical protein
MNNLDEKEWQQKYVKVGAKIPYELHLAAKQIYSMQGTSIGERVEQLLRADLKKTIKRSWFVSLPEAGLLNALVNWAHKKKE